MEEEFRELKYKNKEIKCLFDLPEIFLGKKEMVNSLNEIDFEEFCRVASKQKLLSLFYYLYKEKLEQSFREYIEKKIDYLKFVKENQLKELMKIKYFFSTYKIDFVLIKGFALSKIIYNDLFLRDFSDCDIIIDYDSFPVADRIMKALGYKSNMGIGELPELLPLELYELIYYKECERNISIKMELKLGTSSIKNIDTIKKFVNNNKKIFIGSEKYNSFSMNDTFILLCTNTYVNFELEFAVARLRDLVDIKIFIEIYTSELDWDYILEFSSSNKQTHQIYAVMNLVNYYYRGTFDMVILNKFSIDNLKYAADEFQYYRHGWMRDWIVEPVDLMLDRKWHFKEICFEQSLKAYSSHNRNYYNKKLISNSDNIKFNQEYFQGLKSNSGKISYMYIFTHTKDNIYFKLKFDMYEENSDISTSLMIFDIDRREPRKTIMFKKVGKKWSSCTESSLNYREIESNDSQIVLEISKRSLRILDENGKNLCIYMYSLIKFNDSSDFALKDDNLIMDYENPIMLYLCD